MPPRSPVHVCGHQAATTCLDFWDLLFLSRKGVPDTSSWESLAVYSVSSLCVPPWGEGASGLPCCCSFHSHHARPALWAVLMGTGTMSLGDPVVAAHGPTGAGSGSGADGNRCQPQQAPGSSSRTSTGSCSGSWSSPRLVQQASLDPCWILF